MIKVQKGEFLSNYLKQINVKISSKVSTFSGNGDMAGTFILSFFFTVCYLIYDKNMTSLGVQ